jgi:N-acyl-L-homoserine lactone synthetase
MSSNIFGDFSLHIPTNNLSEVFNVRHKVYCEELGYEPTTESKQERDTFDNHSHHVLIRDVKLNIPIATVRAVPSVSCTQVMPFQHKEELKEVEVTRPCFEVSRLCVLKQYRTAAIVPTLLYLTIKELMDTHQIYISYAVMQPVLARHLRTMGFDYKRVSNFFDLRGKRALYVVDSRTQRVIEPRIPLQNQIKECVTYQICNRLD